MTVKIASLEYRSRFGVSDGRQVVGFEVGSDISTALDLDDYFVYDRNPEQVTKAVADILYKHISSELPEDYLPNVYGVKTSDAFVPHDIHECNSVWRTSPCI